MSKTDYFINTKKISLYTFDDSILSILNDFESAFTYHSQLQNYTATPLISLPNLARELNIGGIWIKNEAMRFGVPAIKMLGASYAMHKILKANRKIESFCTATDGNHGRAVAWSARQLGKKAIVFVPDYTVKSRIENMKAEQAQVITVPGDYDTAVAQAVKYADERHCQLIQDTAWQGYLKIPALITAGYYTQMNEIELQTRGFSNSFDLIFVQAGVGSWPSAIAHFAYNHPSFNNIKIVCVEPYESDCFLESARRNTRTSTKKSQQTIMAGLNCGTPSLLAWEVLRKESDVFLSIDDSYAIESMKRYYFPLEGDPRIESGESGASGLAGLLALLKDRKLKIVRDVLNINRNTRVLLFNTEGITDREFFKKNIL